MAKSTREKMLDFYSTDEGKRKINTVKNGILNNSVRDFPEIFATIAPSNLQILLGKEYYAFLKHVADPGRFSLNEIETMAKFLGLEYDQMYEFVRRNMMERQKQSKA